MNTVNNYHRPNFVTVTDQIPSLLPTKFRHNYRPNSVTVTDQIPPLLPTKFRHYVLPSQPDCLYHAYTLRDEPTPYLHLLCPSVWRATVRNVFVNIILLTGRWQVIGIYKYVFKYAYLKIRIFEDIIRMPYFSNIPVFP